MELLRKCPCAVFLLRDNHPLPHPLVCAAVDASNKESDEQALNVKLMELALLMASHLQAGPPKLLQAWTVDGEQALRVRMPSGEFDAYVAHIRERAAADLAQLVESVGNRIAQTDAILRRGKPEDVIPQFVVSEGIGLLVMGTVARRGIRGMLFGNTAERVLGELPCLVLIVKPEGFVSPVRLDAR